MNDILKNYYAEMYNAGLYTDDIFNLFIEAKTMTAEDVQAIKAIAKGNASA
jgi:hypothetical protein